MTENIPQHAEKAGDRLLDPVLASWQLFWRYVFSQSALVFFFAAIVCFVAYNWADLSVFTKFFLISGFMLFSAVFPAINGLDRFSGSAGLLLCCLLAGPLLAVYGQYYQTGANAWELFRTWAFFLLPLALVSRKTGLWFCLWVVSSLAGFLFLSQQNAPYDMDVRPDIWITLPFVLSQIVFLMCWEALAAIRPKGRFLFLDARWLPRMVAGMILVLLTLTMEQLVFYGPWTGGFFISPLLSPQGLVYCLFLCIAAVYYTRRVLDLSVIAMGIVAILATGAFLLLGHFTHWWKDGAALLGIAAFVLLVSVVGIKLLLFLHHRKEQREKTTNPLKTEKPSFSIDFFNLRNFSVAFKGPEIPIQPIYDENWNRIDIKPEPPSPWEIPILMGIGAWLTVPFLLAGLVIALQSTLDKRQMILFFLGIMGISAVFSRFKGSFFTQTGLCLGLAGTLGASFFIFTHYHTFVSDYELAPLILLCMAGCLFISGRMYRLLASCTAISCFFIQFLLKMTAKNRELLFFQTQVWPADNVDFLWVLLALLFCAFSLFLTLFWFKSRDGEKREFLNTPLLSGGFLSIVVISIVLSFDAFLFHVFRPRPIFAEFAFSLGAGAGLLLFSVLISRALQFKPAAMIGLLAASLLLSATGFRIYWVPVGFLLLCLARHATSLPLIGLGTAYLGFMTVMEYYSQSTSLLHKSFSLAMIGVLLGIFAFGLKLVLKKKIGPEKEEFSAASDGVKDNWSPLTDRICRGFVLVCLCFFLVMFAGSVREKEALLASGTQLVLALRPVDPRSLMQGDYMVLSLEVEGQIASALKKREKSDPAQLQGLVRVRPDKKGVARFSRLEDGSPMEQNEFRLVYRRKRRSIQISSGSFFFQEGYGKAYSAARFAVLRVDEKGEALLTDLLDAKQQEIGK